MVTIILFLVINWVLKIVTKPKDKIIKSIILIKVRLVINCVLKIVTKWLYKVIFINRLINIDD